MTESKWVKRYSELREKENMTDSIDKLVEEVARETNIEKDKEIVKLVARVKELEWHTDEIIRTAGNAQDTLIKKIERLKSGYQSWPPEIKNAWDSYLTENNL